MQDDLIQRREAAAILGVTGQMIDTYRIRGILHSVQYIGRGRHRYKRKDVQELLKIKK